jgi:hypothetical protein
MAEKKSDDLSTKATRFYIEQAERAAPKMRNAVDDWQRVYTGFVAASFKVQKNVLKSMGLETKFVDQVEEAVKSSTEAAMKVQKELSDASIDFSLKTAKSLLEKTEKTDKA